MYAEPSSEQANVDPTFEAENWKVADVDATLPLGPAVIVVSGAPLTAPISRGSHVLSMRRFGVNACAIVRQETSLWF